jgi:hypothetical protein
MMRTIRYYTILFLVGWLIVMGCFRKSTKSTSISTSRSSSIEHAANSINTSGNFLDPSKVKVSYVTSFYASHQPGGEVANPHRQEIKAAILANIHNQHLHQIVVFLDGVSAQSNCIHFILEMRELNIKYMSTTTTSTTSSVLMKEQEETQEDVLSKLTCIDVHTGQPTYYDMFQNTLHKDVLGDVIILANADQVFDNTISVVRDLNPYVLVVLGTKGFGYNIPPKIKYFYDILVGTNYVDNTEMQQSNKDMCKKTRYSWDTWIFKRVAIRDRLKEHDFQRMNTNNENVSFYMNENGAENAALWALQQSFPFTSVYNACDVIYSWSFHFAPKQHHLHHDGTSEQWLQVTTAKRSPLYSPPGHVPKPWGGSGQVPHPYPSKKPECVRTNTCFL